jgi:hypothetical protein
LFEWKTFFDGFYKLYACIRKYKKIGASVTDLREQSLDESHERG